jgi:hypothetical protein
LFKTQNAFRCTRGRHVVTAWLTTCTQAYLYGHYFIRQLWLATSSLLYCITVVQTPDKPHAHRSAGGTVKRRMLDKIIKLYFRSTKHLNLIESL